MMMEIIFGTVALVGLVAFIIFLWKQTGSSVSKVKRRQKKKPKKPKPIDKQTKDDDEIPKEWREDNPGRPSKSLPISVDLPKKIRVPGLRTSKRILAFAMLLLNFFISQATLMSSPATQPMFWLFFFNSLILLDYLWKTRRRETA